LATRSTKALMFRGVGGVRAVAASGTPSGAQQVPEQAPPWSAKRVLHAQLLGWRDLFLELSKGWFSILRSGLSTPEEAPESSGVRTFP
jgi:hypothetical protein